MLKVKIVLAVSFCAFILSALPLFRFLLAPSLFGFFLCFVATGFNLAFGNPFKVEEEK
ncbi:MAG: hypothetical protein Q4A60_06425 [Pasteurellaceae bacterium]|nr:hypothetical protein [Pasteurellaceae bacterium]